IRRPVTILVSGLGSFRAVCALSFAIAAGREALPGMRRGHARRRPAPEFLFGYCGNRRDASGSSPRPMAHAELGREPVRGRRAETGATYGGPQGATVESIAVG